MGKISSEGAQNGDERSVSIPSTVASEWDLSERAHGPFGPRSCDLLCHSRQCVTSLCPLADAGL
jgi:hypothetical protein